MMEIVPVKERRVNNEDVNSKQKKKFYIISSIGPCNSLVESKWWT